MCIAVLLYVEGSWYISYLGISCLFFFFFKQKTAYEMRISDWSSDVCSSDLPGVGGHLDLTKQPLRLLRIADDRHSPGKRLLEHAASDHREHHQSGRADRQHGDREPQPGPDPGVFRRGLGEVAQHDQAAGAHRASPEQAAEGGARTGAGRV